jgi:hypothetical protein
MSRPPLLSPHGYFEADDDADEYFCPICGEGLSKSNFTTPGEDYYCPSCGTPQTPSRLLLMG